MRTKTSLSLQKNETSLWAMMITQDINLDIFTTDFFLYLFVHSEVMSDFAGIIKHKGH